MKHLGKDVFASGAIKNRKLPRFLPAPTHFSREALARDQRAAGDGSRRRTSRRRPPLRELLHPLLHGLIDVKLTGDGSN
ncbi:hypothetical protein BS78_03G035800 [Paspalum vaginatum]|nr:hypothetical protein BS78_03G035800 [Paspalum vaginatum]